MSSLIIAGTGYVSLIQLNKIAGSNTADNQKLLAASTQIILIYVLISIIVIVCLGAFIGLSVTNRIRNLRNIANKITLGESEVMIDFKGSDEIHDIALSLKSVIDSQRKSEELHSRSEKKYKDLYENSLDLYRTIDTNGTIIDCNKSYAERLGYTKKEIIGESIFKHTADDNVKAMTESFETWKKTGNVKNKEIWLKTKDAIIFPTLISANNLYAEKGILIGSNTIIKDISELKKLDKLKDEFASMITHELKSPLTPIMGRCEMLKEAGLLGDLNTLQLDSINKIQQNVLRLERLIRDVLDAQKLEMGHMRFDKAKFDVTEFMTEVHNDYLSLMKEKQIDFVDSTKEKLILKSDMSRIRQVIDNLVLNAADFTPKKEGKIEIGAKSEDGKVVFCVKDNGAGIPKEMQPNMFRKFFQVDTSLTRKHSGTGLGLVVCKGIIEGLGGRIWLDSDFGMGTSVYFTIPKELN